jgi:hypothetical protein
LGKYCKRKEYLTLYFLAAQNIIVKNDGTSQKSFLQLRNFLKPISEAVNVRNEASILNFFGISMEFKRRKIAIGETISFYFLQNVLKCNAF